MKIYNRDIVKNLRELRRCTCSPKGPCKGGLIIFDCNDPEKGKMELSELGIEALLDHVEIMERDSASHKETIENQQKALEGLRSVYEGALKKACIALEDIESNLYPHEIEELTETKEGLGEALKQADEIEKGEG